MKTDYRVKGMHCESCVAKVTDALRGVPGVRDVSVSLETNTASIEADRPVEFNALNDAAAKAGEYRLAPAEKAKPDAAPSGDGAPPESLYPLFLIVAYILGAVLLIAYASGVWTVAVLMRHFMAGFFLVFSFFKLLDLPGFVSAYRGYDLLARRSAVWAWAYPFVELALGAAYLIDFFPILTNSVTVVLMAIGAAGVLRALLAKRAIRCACLGTALNLPMTKVTLVEDTTMAIMAATMLAMRLLK